VLTLNKNVFRRKKLNRKVFKEVILLPLRALHESVTGGNGGNETGRP
jgi:hypothetical protein